MKLFELPLHESEFLIPFRWAHSGVFKILKEIPDRDIERLADFIEQVRANSVLAALVLLQLLKRDARFFACSI